MGILSDGGRYMFLKWNGKYGSEAKFVVLDQETGKQSMFTPGRVQDLVWTRTELADTPEVKDWDDFGKESVDNLEEVAF